MTTEDLFASEQSAHQARVEAFLRGIRRPIPAVPEVPSRELLATMGRTLLEETFEWLEAAGLVVSSEGPNSSLTFEHLEVYVDPDKEPDLVQMAKEASDVSVVNAGNMISCGIKDEAVLRAVDENNLLKIATGRYCEKTGKFLKPPNHPKTDVKPLLRKQGWVGE